MMAKGNVSLRRSQLSQHDRCNRRGGAAGTVGVASPGESVRPWNDWRHMETTHPGGLSATPLMGQTAGVSLHPPTMSPTNILIVDDEALGRDCIRFALDPMPGFQVVGEATCGEEAIRDIRRLDPDIVVLDIQMPGLSGFDVIREIGPERMPPTVLVTAHDRFALQAFDASVVDYVLKPFDDARLVRALDRARSIHEGQRTHPPGLLSAVSHASPGVMRYTRRILVRKNDRLYFVPVQEIDWIEAAGNTLRLNGGGRTHEIRMTLQAIMDTLDPALFLRIHRSTAVRLAAIKEIQPWFSGDYMVILTDGHQLRLSRSFRERVLRVLH